MPRLLKALGPREVQTSLENIDDKYLAVIEHSSLVYLIEAYGGSKSRMHKVASFIALGLGWEYMVSYLIHGQQRTGGDA